MEASVINEEIPESSDEFYDIRWTKKRDQIFIKLAPNKTNGSDVIWTERKAGSWKHWR